MHEKNKDTNATEKKKALGMIIPMKANMTMICDLLTLVTILKN